MPNEPGSDRPAGASDVTRGSSLFNEFDRAYEAPPQGTDPDPATVSGAETVPSPAPPAVAPALERVGPYRLVSELGHGGMGVVYRAWDEELQRECAVKLLVAGKYAPEEIVARFEREARAVARMGKQANIVTVFGFGREGTTPYYAMELIDGDPLDVHCAKAAPSLSEKASLAEKVARALQCAHEHGIVHRDVKPQNILVRKDGEPQVSDFGLALDAEAAVRLTSGMQVMGSPAYMAPEQARGDTLATDPRTDVYGLGAVLYEMLTGRAPHDGDTLDKVLRAVEEGTIRPPRSIDPSVPRDIETICLKCLEHDREKRYASAKDVADDLRRFIDHQPILARPVGRIERLWRRCRRHPRAIGASLAGVLVLCLVSWLLVRKNEEDVKRAGIESLMKHGDDLRAEGSYAGAVEAYDAVWDKADAAGQAELLKRMVACCGMFKDPQESVAPWRRVLAHAPKKSFEELDEACAMALAWDMEPWGTSSEQLSWMNDEAKAKQAAARLETALRTATGSPELQEPLRMRLDRIREKLHAGFYRVVKGDDLGLPNVDTEMLKQCVDDKAADGWDRAKAAYVLGQRLEEDAKATQGKAKDDAKKEALTRYRQAWEVCGCVFPFYYIEDRPSVRPANGGGMRGVRWPQSPLARFVSKAGEAVRRLDPAEPPRLRGWIMMYLDEKDPRPKGFVPGVKINLVAMPSSRPNGNMPLEHPATVYFPEDGMIHLGVADGEYSVTIEEAPPQEDVDGARDEGRSFGIDFTKVLPDVTIQGQAEQLTLPFRLLDQLTLTPPADGASLEEQKGPLAWTSSTGAQGYTVTVEIHAKDAAGKEAYEPLAHLEAEIAGREQTTAWLSDLLASQGPTEAKRFRDAIAAGAVVRWGVEAHGAKDRRIASSGPLELLPVTHGK